MPEERWCDLSKAEKLDTLSEAVVDPTKRAAVMPRVEKFLRGRSMDDPNYVVNVILREAWRHDHGNTAEWDRSALAAGVIIR